MAEKKASATGNLVIVESPAKAKTIEGFLGKDFTVRSSYGHIRDLPMGDKAVDIKNNFNPRYEISEDKQKVVDELKKLAKKSGTVWLATDEDREGEAISWHLAEALGLDIKKPNASYFTRSLKKPSKTPLPTRVSSTRIWLTHSRHDVSSTASWVLSFLRSFGKK